MKKKWISLLAAFVAVLVCGGVFSACDDIGNTGKERTVVTCYGLYDENIAKTYTVFDGTFPLDSPPHRDHLTFLGFFDAEVGGTQIVDEYGICHIYIENDMTLWAHWQGNECNIVFDAGEGTLSQDLEEMSLIYGSTLSLFPVPQREGYAFVGWTSEGNLVSEESVVTKPLFDSQNYTFTPGSDTVVLRALYEVKHYTLTLDYNDGSYRNDTVTVDHGSTIASVFLPANDTGSSMIVGWSTERTRLVEFSGTFDSDITLYAIWRDYKVFRLYTDEETFTSQKVFRDEEYILPEVTRYGYEFDGWYASPYFSGIPAERVNYGSAYDSYYAKWVATKYRITFVLNGGDAQLDTMTYTIEESVKLPDAGKKQYCEFVGWCRNDDLSDPPFDFLEEGSSGDLTLYAKWKGEDRTVILDPADGYVSKERFSIEYGTFFYLPVPEREGYIFLGWFTDGEIRLTDEYGSGLNEYEIAERETTLYAHWQIKTYTVEYQTNGGSPVPAQEYEHGAALEFPEPPTMPNMELEGWYFDSGLTLRAEEGTPVLGNMTLYANWYQMSAIRTTDDLKAMAQHPDYNYYLANDINFDGEIWNPIENFSGVFDGRGCRIFNFTISVSDTVENLGLFATNLGTIENLNLEAVVYNYTATGSTNAGIFAGVNFGKIMNCKLSKSTINLRASYTNTSQSFNFGCFAGDNQGSLENCNVESSNTCTVVFSMYVNTGSVRTSYFRLGGLAGSNNKTITNCQSAMSSVCEVGAANTYTWVYDTGSYAHFYAGGIAGCQTSEGTITCSSSEPSVTANIGNCGGDESRGAYIYIGGLVGEAGGSVETCKTTCNFDVAVYSSGQIGGIAGRVITGGSIANCYAVPTIETSRSRGDLAVGGAVGVNAGTVRNCYSSGTILSQKGATGGFAGNNEGTGTISRCFSLTKLKCDGDNVGKFYRNNAGTISNCFYADTVCEGDSYYDDASATEKPERELIGYEFLCDELYWNDSYWDFDPEGSASPRLKWESE